MINPKRLAIFLPALHGGGAERTMLNLAHGIAVRGCRVDLVLASAVGPYMSQIPDTLNLIDLKVRKTMFSYARLAGYLWRERPDALLSALCRANIAAICARWLAGVPTRVVISERNTLSRWGQESQELHKRITARAARYLYHRADGITAVSHGVADDLSQTLAVPRSRICVIYNPVITQTLRSKMGQPLDHPWFAANEPPVVLAVGSLSQQKDFGTLLTAFAKVRQSQSVRLLILGEGEERANLERRAQQLGIDEDLALPGWVDNPYPYMREAGCFVLSSRWEGLPGVLIEALHAGVPLVATDCPSGPREILAGGRYGRLVPVGDEGIMAEAMAAALASTRTEPPHEAWLPFEMEHVVDQYIDMLFGSGQRQSLPGVTLAGGFVSETAF